MPKFVKISSDFVCIYEKIAGGWGSAPDPTVTAVCLYIENKRHWRTTGSWKMLLGSWKVLKIFVTKREGTLLE